MATIVTFKPSGGPSRATTDQRTAGQQTSQCEVLLFTGVRYERWVDAPAPAASEPGLSTKQRQGKRALALAD
jgi:hypothetical protein